MGKQVFTYRPDPKDERDYKFSSAPVYEKLQLSRPSAVDWSGHMSRIKNQGTLGSCVGFAVTAMKEFQEIYERYLDQTKEYGPSDEELSNLSESYVYWNAKEYDPDKSEGTCIRYAMQVLQKKGVPTESFWPYSDRVTGQPLPGVEQAAAWAKIGSYWRITTLEEILTALSTQPIPIGIQCYSGIEEVGANGIVPIPQSTDIYQGGHAVCAVGYDDEKKLIKFKNSWGTTWGENGYGYLPYDYFRHIIDAWTCLDLKIESVEPVPEPITPTPEPVVPVQPDSDGNKNKSLLKVVFAIAGVIITLLILYKLS